MINNLKLLVEIRGERPKILIVDDQPINIRALHEIFKEDCEVFMATNGQQALELAASCRPDLVLLDILMPGLDGHEVCRLLKLDVVTKDIPVIFLTAQHTSDDEAVGFRLGVVDYITKPINSFVVRARVEIHLALKLQTEYLRSIAFSDGLTGIANRRRFDSELTQDWLQCSRVATSLTLIMIDVDYFKKYNDSYGHLMGDECLRKVAHTIRDEFRRPYDLVARYGGEEFAGLLPDTDLQGGMYVAEQIRQSVARLQLEHKGSAIDNFVTVSLGVATCVPGLALNSEALTAAADAQLYEAKLAGRNQSKGTCLINQ